MYVCTGQESGGVDFRTLGNQTAARVLEEVRVALVVVVGLTCIPILFSVVSREQFGRREPITL